MMFNSIKNRLAKALKLESTRTRDIRNKKSLRQSEVRVYEMTKADNQAEFEHRQKMEEMQEIEAEWKRLGC